MDSNDIHGRKTFLKLSFQINHDKYPCFHTICFITSSSIEYTDATVSPVMDLVPPQGGVAVRLDPHSCHSIVKDLIVLDEA